jgi:hypothetical protein
LNGALAENIFQQVVGHVVVSTGAKMRGILLLVKTDVLFEADSSLVGRSLVQTMLCATSRWQLGLARH